MREPVPSRLSVDFHSCSPVEFVGALHEFSPAQMFKILERLLDTEELQQALGLENFIAKITDRIKKSPAESDPNPCCLQLTEACDIMHQLMIQDRYANKDFNDRALQLIGAVYAEALMQTSTVSVEPRGAIVNRTLALLQKAIKGIAEDQADIRMVIGSLKIISSIVSSERKDGVPSRCLLKKPALSNLSYLVKGFYQYALERLQDKDCCSVITECSMFVLDLDPQIVMPAVREVVHAIRDFISEKEKIYGDEAEGHISDELKEALCAALYALVRAEPKIEDQEFWETLYVEGSDGWVFGLLGLLGLKPRETAVRFVADYSEKPEDFEPHLAMILEGVTFSSEFEVIVKELRKLPLERKRELLAAYTADLSQSRYDSEDLEQVTTLQEQLGIPIPSPHVIP